MLGGSAVSVTADGMPIVYSVPATGVPVKASLTSVPDCVAVTVPNTAGSVICEIVAASSGSLVMNVSSDAVAKEALPATSPGGYTSLCVTVMASPEKAFGAHMASCCAPMHALSVTRLGTRTVYSVPSVACIEPSMVSSVPAAVTVRRPRPGDIVTCGR